MPIVAGIDGTGPNDDAEYREAFEPDRVKGKLGSFVYRLCKREGRYYRRGPNAVGWGLSSAVDDGVAFVVNKRRIFPNEPILLTGYSRGAAGAVVMAKELKKKGIQVRALLLFDCVDRQINMDASVIPNNVGFVQHVIRNPAARSRMTFGNDGLSYYPPTVFPVATMFMCTHGGMGGTPWDIPAGKNSHDFVDEGTAEALASPVRFGPFWNYHTNVTYEQDKTVSARVWQFVQPFILTHGYN